MAATRKKWASILPLDPGLIGELEVGLVHQAGSAQGVPGSFALELPARDSAELAVDRVEQAVHGLGVAPADLVEKIGDLLADLVTSHVTCCKSGVLLSPRWDPAEAYATVLLHRTPSALLRSALSGYPMSYSVPGLRVKDRSQHFPSKESFMRSPSVALGLVFFLFACESPTAPRENPDVDAGRIPPVTLGGGADECLKKRAPEKLAYAQSVEPGGLPSCTTDEPAKDGKPIN